MAANHDTAFFKSEYQRLKDNPSQHQDVIRGHIAEIQEILDGLAKGLKILERLNKRPEKKVEENHVEFQQLSTLFNKLID